ncbi:MAG: phasin family protein [Rhodoblastus sp.]
MAIDFEAFQKFGKEQFEASSVAMAEVCKGLQAIATETGDYSKKSFQDGSVLVEKLVGVKMLDEAITLQTEFAKASYENLVAQTAKINEMYQGVAKEAFKPVEGAIAKFQAAAK